MKTELIAQEVTQNKIFFIRSKKVMFDKDLAGLYGVETRILNKAVTRNLVRFPSDFCFHLLKFQNQMDTLSQRENVYPLISETSVTQKDFIRLMFHFGTSKRGGTRKLPRVFTEHGILMLSSVLNGERAIKVNIQIMRTFTKLREMLASHKELKRKIEEMERKHDNQFKVIFKAIEELLEPTAFPNGPLVFK